MTDQKYNDLLAEYRPANWTDRQFEAAVDQAGDNVRCDQPIISDEWLSDFACHLGDIIEGRIPNDYWNGK